MGTWHVERSTFYRVDMTGERREEEADRNVHDKEERRTAWKTGGFNVYSGLYTAVANLVGVSTVISRRPKGKTMGWGEGEGRCDENARRHAAFLDEHAAAAGVGLYNGGASCGRLVPLERVHGYARARKGTKVEWE